MADETQNENETAVDDATEPDAAPEAQAAPAPAAAPAPPAEPVEKLHPKVARKRSRSRHSGAANAPRTQEERAEARTAVRAAKAKQRRASRSTTREKAKARRGDAPPPTAASERVAGQPKVRQGLVVSDKPDKTIIVRVDVARRHRRYEKVVRSSSTLHAHDERNDAHEGDTVTVVETRPMSRTKRWRLVEVLERAK